MDLKLSSLAEPIAAKITQLGTCLLKIRGELVQAIGMLEKKKQTMGDMIKYMERG